MGQNVELNELIHEVYWQKRIDIKKTINIRIVN